jgi:hypothetical protein
MRGCRIQSSSSQEERKKAAAAAAAAAAGHEFEWVDGTGVVTLSFFNERAMTIVAALLH